MSYWLMKSEPSVYSFDRLREDKATHWNGVRNFMARSHLKAMVAGDQAFFYHSNADPPCIVGTMRITKAAYPDPTQFDKDDHGYEPKATPEKPYWYMVDVAYEKAFAQPVTREQMKGRPELRGMALFKYGRLSVGPVAPEEWAVICAMGGL